MTVQYVDASTFTDDFLEGLRDVGDPPADDAIGHFFDDELHHPAAGLLKDALIKYSPGSDESSAALGTFVDDHPEPPSWYDADLLRAGQDLFAQYMPQFGMALWMASIPAGYAGARDVAVLRRTAELVSNPMRRFLETGQYVIDVMTPGYLEPGAKGASDIRHVRLMHAAVRYMLTHEAEELKQPTWEAWRGVPINQKALLATQFTFSVVGIQSLQKFGIHLTDDEKEAYTYAWSLIGHMMGVRDDLLPLTYDDSAALWQRIKETEYGSSPDGIELSNAALAVMRDLIPGRFADGIAASGVRYLIPDAAKLLDVPRANWTYLMFPPMHWFGHVMNRFEKDSPLGRAITERLGRAFFREFVKEEYTHLDGLRDARAEFEVSTHLKRELGMD